MSEKIYVKLLDEGTLVYRPVNALMIKKNIYKIEKQKAYDPEDEIWEFIPGMKVMVEKSNLEGEFVLIAISEFKE